MFKSTQEPCRQYSLPWPPSINRYWRSFVRNGKACVYLSSQGSGYKKSVKAYVTAQGNQAPLTGRLTVSIDLHAPDNRKRDIDNTLKGLLDSLNGLAWIDDSQIDQLTIRRLEPITNGACIVRIWERTKPKAPLPLMNGTKTNSGEKD